MVRCLILVGPEKWCLNHKEVIGKYKESFLLYDKFPTKESAKKQVWDMIDKGNFQTFIYISKNWGGDGKIGYVSYTPPKSDKICYSPNNDEFYLDDELISGNKMEAGRSGRSFKILSPKKPPGHYPKWDYYDFGVSRIPIDIKDAKEYIKLNMPRAYNIAIKITDIQKIEPITIIEFGNFDGTQISISQLENSFIVAQTKNDFRKNFRWI